MVDVLFPPLITEKRKNHGILKESRKIEEIHGKLNKKHWKWKNFKESKKKYEK